MKLSQRELIADTSPRVVWRRYRTGGGLGSRLGYVYLCVRAKHIRLKIRRNILHYLPAIFHNFLAHVHHCAKYFLTHRKHS